MTQMQTYNVDGSLGPQAELRQDADSQLWLDGELVVAVNLWGTKVALSLTTRLVLVDIEDFGRSTRYGDLGAPASDEARS
jgi:hypothetical protein